MIKQKLQHILIILLGLDAFARLSRFRGGLGEGQFRCLMGDGSNFWTVRLRLQDGHFCIVD
ncbi:hypothetical protein BDE02_08G055700 [Populus trichocarpa]|nr:hypothetical protein BDE02_08G055700 [Populus trichocarpa]